MPKRRSETQSSDDDDFIKEVHADEASEMETTDDSDCDSDCDSIDDVMSDIDSDLRDIAAAIIGADTCNSTEDDFSGFDEDFMEVPRHFDRTGDFMARWQQGTRPRVQLPFKGTTGLGQYIELPDNPKPKDYFDLFIQEEDYVTIATETNRYFHQEVDGKSLKPCSRVHMWKDTNAEEIKVFTVMTIAMALTVKRDITEYWSTNDVLNTPFFPQCMPRDRFWLILTYLHLSDNRTMPGRNSPNFAPINKLGHLYKKIIHRFSKVYKPHQNISVDEGMVPWKGNLSFKVYNPDKPKKYGMKAFMLCDSHNGYVCKFRLYTGKTNKEVSAEGKTYDLVMDMINDYVGKGYHVYMDNFYSSVTLYINMWEQGLGATGTLRGNRKGIPEEVRKAPRKKNKGDMTVYHNQDLLVMRYEDRKSVLLMSTVEDVEIIETGRKHRGTGELIKKPRIVNSYNKYMGGVDRADQMLSYSPFRVKTLKWWKRVWFHILNVALMNSYIIYKEFTTDKPLKSSREFRAAVVHDVIQSVDTEQVPSLCRRPRGRPSTSEDAIIRLHGRHFPTKIESVGKKKNLTRICVVCSKAKRLMLKRQVEEGRAPPAKRKRVGRESSYECVDCKVCLCVAPCFKLYHTTVDYCKAYISFLEKGTNQGEDPTLQGSDEDQM